MEPHKQLLLANKAWVQEKLKIRPDFFGNIDSVITGFSRFYNLVIKIFQAFLYKQSSN